jgi:parallel beta helix pectate lyase-like protein
MASDMGGRLKGVPIPSSPDPKMQAFLRAVHDAFTREEGGVATSEDIQNQVLQDVVREKPMPPDLGTPRLKFYEVDATGLINFLPQASAETTAIFRFTSGSVTLSAFADDGATAEGNLVMSAGNFYPTADDIIVFSSNGTKWYEVGRSSSNSDKTFIPVRKFGVIPNTGSDMTVKLQAVLNNPANAGAVLVFEPGVYIVNGVTVSQNNMDLFLPPGCTLLANAQTVHAVIYVSGTLDTSTFKNVVVNPNPNDLAFPRGGERSVWISPADAASGFFTVNSWITIEDEEDVPGGRWGGGSDPNYQLEHHMEMARIFAINAGTGEIKLWFPLVNGYTNVAATAPRLRKLTPVEGFRIWGGGKISNPITPAVTTSHGLQLIHAVEATVDGIVFERCYNSCIAITRVQDSRVINCEMRDAVFFDSKGYGLTMYGGIRVTVSGNTCRRLRHCVDVSFFSRQVTVSTNVLIGSTTSNLHTHPCVEGISFIGNVIDGGSGQDGLIPSLDYGTDPTAPQANGINIDEMAKNISIIGNEIRNMRRAGILVDMGSLGFPTEFVSIVGNTIENCVTARRLTAPPSGFTDIGAIRLIESAAFPGQENRGIVVKGNTLRDPGQFGIISNVSGAVIEGNWIYRPADKVQAISSVTIGIGIWIRGGLNKACVHPIIKNNTIEGAIQNGIRIGVNLGTQNVVNAVVEGNSVFNSGQASIFLEETAPNATVRNNLCEGNTAANADGLNTQSDNGLFEGNTSVNNIGAGSVGIRLIAGADNNVVRFNVFGGPGFPANAGGEILNAGAGNFIIHQDLTNDRMGIGTATPGGRFTILSDTSPAPSLFFRTGGTVNEVLWASQQSDAYTPAFGFGWRMRQDEAVTGDLFIDRMNGGAAPLETVQLKRAVAGGIRFGGFVSAAAHVHEFNADAGFARGIEANLNLGGDPIYDALRVYSAAFPVVPLFHVDPSIDSVNLGGSDQAASARCAVRSKNDANKATFLAQNANAGGTHHLFLFTGPAFPSGGGNFGWRFEEENLADGNFRLVALDGGILRRAMHVERATGNVRFPFSVMIGSDTAPAFALDVFGSLRVQGTTPTHLFFVDRPNDRVGFGTDVPQVLMHGLRKETPNNTVLEVLRIQRDSLTGGGAVGIGVGFGLWAESATDGTSIAAAQFNAALDVATLATADSSLRLLLYDGGTAKEVVRFEGATPRINLHNNAFGSPQITLSCLDGAAVFNEQGNSSDFRVESNLNAFAIHVSGADDAVGIGIAATGGGAQLFVGAVAGVSTLFNGDIGDLNSPNSFCGSAATGIWRGFGGYQYDIQGRLLLNPGHFAANVTVGNTELGENYLSMDTGSARSVTLPAASSKNGRAIFIADEDRNASVRNITLIPNGADTINGVAGNYVLKVNGCSALIVAVATQNDWQIAAMTPGQSAAYTPTNVTTDRAYDANATTVDELADVLGTLIADLQAAHILG